MSARGATTADLDWMVAVLDARRESLVQLAPVFWRPAPDASVIHRGFLEHLLGDGGARAYRTDDALVVAVQRGAGWLVDDMHVPGERWVEQAGGDLWSALANDVGGASVRFVSPAYEHQRAEFARDVGLRLAESWWLRELDSAGGESGVKVPLPGAEAVTVSAPPVYAPPGPILFLPSAPSDPSVAVPTAVVTATDRGCACVVVNVVGEEGELTASLRDEGFRRHCDFYTGPIDARLGSVGGAHCG